MAAAVSGCGHSEQAVQAHDAALRDLGKDLTLTPAMRAQIARAVAPVARNSIHTLIFKYQYATISPLKADYDVRTYNAPYYCVNLRSLKYIPMVTSRGEYYRVTPIPHPGGGYSFNVTHSEYLRSGDSTQGCATLDESAAIDFPEAIAALNPGAAPMPEPAADEMPTALAPAPKAPGGGAAAGPAPAGSADVDAQPKRMKLGPG